MMIQVLSFTIFVVHEDELHDVSLEDESNWLENFGYEHKFVKVYKLPVTVNHISVTKFCNFYFLCF